ncbi:precorrin-6Y C5,15-methyltransferase (decarboxylating) subunit CbiT [Methanospirillum stamsii]|nr:precorrin-6Y C5,15-methyltransferase (decarboxylating) subunit CbiT [Methanospirillum stamsii]
MTMCPLEKPPTGGPTKDEILAIALQKLGLHPDDIFADIGCGTGKVTITTSPLVSEIHAIDVREEASRWTEQEIIRLNIRNVTIHHKDAVEVLSSLEKLDTAFVGGSRNLTDVLFHLARLRVRTVVISAVLLETLNSAIKTLQEYEMFHEVIHIQVSKSMPLAGGIMLKPIDPVYLIIGGRKE